MIMHNPKIYILSDKKGIGKTTSLQKWVKINPQLKGFLTPIVNGKRMFQIIETNNYLPMETESKELIIGRYSFNKKNFETVAQMVLKLSSGNSNQTIIIDEIGPLEINKNQGFHNLVLKLTEIAANNPKLFFVVRESCLQDFITKYKLKNFEVINLKDFHHKFLTNN